MRRRSYLATVGTALGVASLSGCTGVLPSGDGGDSEPTYPGGTLVVQNTGNSPVAVSVVAVSGTHDASLETTVSGGGEAVRREFVSATEGDAVTLGARLGEDGERTTFEFLPGGGVEAPPEVAHLRFESDVEAEATWTAVPGN
jgi:hypothetical protein